MTVLCLFANAQTATPPASGAGTSASPWVISSLENLYWIAATDAVVSSPTRAVRLNAYYRQAANINASATSTWFSNGSGGYFGWFPIGSVTNGNIPFTGNYDGAGFTIDQLYINRPSEEGVGLFGFLGRGTSANPAVIQNLHLTNSDITGGIATGSLAGRTRGDIYTLVEGCSTVGGSVKGLRSTGGLVGANNSYRETGGGEDNPVISKSYANISVEARVGATQKVGGLAGCNQKGTSIDCYSLGSVKAPASGSFERIGGLVGCTELRGRIINCYSNGAVSANGNGSVTMIGGLVGNLGATADPNRGTTVNSYWNTTLSGMATSGGGTGHSDAAMKLQSSFSGFDFSTVWRIDGGNNGYPYLQTVALATYNEWRGGSNDWNAPSNWSGGTLPQASDIVVIPSSTQNPVITSATTVTAKILNIEPEALLTIAPGGSLTVNADLRSSKENILISSDATSTGSLIYSSNIAGATIQRHFQQDRWYIVGVPVTDQFFGSTWYTTNKIPTSGGKYGITSYNESINAWNPFFTGTSAPFTNGLGYLMRRNEAGTVTFSGILTGGGEDLLVTLQKTATPESTAGWNALGNPYPSAISSQSFLTANIHSLDPSFAALYIWDESSGFSGAEYKIISQSGFDNQTGLENYTISPDYLQLGQGFIVRAKEAGSTVKFSPGMRLHQNTVALKSGSTSWPGVILEARQPDRTATTAITFNGEMTPGLDVGFDAGVLKGNSGLSVYTRLVHDNGVDFGLQCLPTGAMEGSLVAIGLEVPETGEVTFTLRKVEMPAHIPVVLEDRLTGIRRNLSGNEDLYTVTIGAGDPPYGRFWLHFGQTTGTEDKEMPEYRAVWSSGQLTLHGLISGETSYRLTDLQGRLLGSGQLQAGTTRNQLETGTAGQGIYLLQVITENRRVSLKVPAGISH